MKNKRLFVILATVTVIVVLSTSTIFTYAAISNTSSKANMSPIYYKGSTYEWDSSLFLGETVVISANVVDETWATASDSVIVQVVEDAPLTSDIIPLSGTELGVSINAPVEGPVSGTFNIAISSKGPDRIGDLQLSINGDAMSLVNYSEESCIYCGEY
jgi:hypothetical protein